MPQYLGVGTAYNTATATAICLTSANANIIGVLFQSSATCAIQIWAGVTATSTVAGKPLSGIIRAAGTATLGFVQGSFVPFPAYASGGITVNITGANDPSITLFWSPAGGA